MQSNIAGVDLPFRAWVNYKLTRAELERQFQEGGGATGYYRREDHAFTLGKKLVSAKVCEGINRESRELNFGYLHPGRNASDDEALEAIDALDCRPVVIEELSAFDLKFPEEKKKYFIAGLGTRLYQPPCESVREMAFSLVMKYGAVYRRTSNASWEDMCSILKLGPEIGDPVNRWRDHVRFLITSK